MRPAAVLAMLVLAAATAAAWIATSGHLENSTPAGTHAALRLAVSPSLVPVVAESGGRITIIYVREGAIVHTGDPWIQLFVADVLRERAELANRIHWAELAPRPDRALLHRLYTEMNRVRLEVNRRTITSPAAGRVLSLPRLSAGDAVAAGTAVGIIGR